MHLILMVMAAYPIVKKKLCRKLWGIGVVENVVAVAVVVETTEMVAKVMKVVMAIAVETRAKVMKVVVAVAVETRAKVMKVAVAVAMETRAKMMKVAAVAVTRIIL